MGTSVNGKKPSVAKWTEDEREVIQRFLADRLASVHTSMRRIAEFGGLELDNWTNRTVKYWRWTESFVKWCIATIDKPKRKNNAKS